MMARQLFGCMGDIRVLPKVLKAAGRFESAPTEEAMRAPFV